MIISAKKKKKNEDIAPVLSKETKQAVKETVKEVSGYNKAKSIWSDGYQFGDVTKTILGVNDMISPIGRNARRGQEIGTNLVLDAKEGNGSFLKNSKAIKNTKDIWSDGYQFGDIQRTRQEIAKGILGTTADVGINLAKGELQTAEGLVDTGRYVVSDVSKAMGFDEYSKNVKERAKQNTTGFILGENDQFNNPKENGWAKKVDEYSIFGNKVDQIVQSVGQQAFRIGLQKAVGSTGVGEGVTKAFNQIEIFAGAYGSAKSEALMNGADDKTANTKALISGTSEYISENLFDSIPGFKTGGIDAPIKNIIGNAAEKTFGKNAGRVAIRAFGALGEGFEEILSNSLETAFTDIANVIDPNYTYGMQEGQGIDENDTFRNKAVKLFKDVYGSAISNESKEAFVTAFFSTLITGAFTDQLTDKQRKDVIKAYAQDNNISEEKATKLFDGIRDYFFSETLFI